jgi:hypothetical protein
MARSEAIIGLIANVDSIPIGPTTDIRLLPIDIVHMTIGSVQIFRKAPKTRAISSRDW